MTFQIRLVTPFNTPRLEFGGAVFSTEIPAKDAQALLCEWEVTDDLYEFNGPSAWFTAEPRENPQMGVRTHAKQLEALSRAKPAQQLYPAHPDLRYRVPHVTHKDVAGRDPFASNDGTRIPKAAALVRNAGGRPEQRWPDVNFRNRVVTSDGVELYGPAWVWERWERRWFRRQAPRGFRGEPEAAYLAKGLGSQLPPDYWPNNEVKVALFSRYHAAICLENSVEPFYFTEKFVDGVLAGCVPVYHAHPTVRDGVLAGARWVDPADFGMSVQKALAYAQSLNRREVDEQNRAWFASASVRATEWSRVWARIAEILKAEAERANPARGA